MLANYVKLLRDGHPQCVATYEQALAITKAHREEAMSSINKQQQVRRHDTGCELLRRPRRIRLCV